jgi:hypothetical protein
LIRYFEPNYAPDADTSWEVNPGALINMDGFAPMPSRAYGSVQIDDYITNITGTNVVEARMFRQIDNSIRLLLFRQGAVDGDIDEYTSGGTRTNRGTGYSGSATGSWDATAWGNQIIAVNYLDAPQSSTGAGFTALGGTPPKARHIASNVNFVMLADVNDGGSNVYSDMVWWSALQNPASWTASIATQAGNIRLLDSPGPITALVAYKDKFLAFKKNAIFLGEYVGPPFIFQWRLISNRIGCVATKSVVECDGLLMWVDTSGFFSFDGAQIRNIGPNVFQTFLNQIGFIGTETGIGGVDPPAASDTVVPITAVRACADDVYGIAWFVCYRSTTLTGDHRAYAFAYSTRTGKWSRCTFDESTTSASPQVLVRATSADINDFLELTLPGVLFVNNETSNAIKKVIYPAASSGTTPTITTGLWGTPDQSTNLSRIYVRALHGSNAFPMETCTVYGFTDEERSISNGTTPATANTSLNCFDVQMAARFKLAVISDANDSLTVLGGVGIAGYQDKR